MTNEPTDFSYSDNYVAFCYKGKRIVVRFVEGEKITMDVHKCIENHSRMKTYKSYHEAKKDNPGKKIITSKGLFAAEGYQKFSFSKGWVLCDPSNYEPKGTKPMTNKVKPFFIRITDDITPQMVQDAFDKCNKLGAKSSNNDEIENFRDWGYFGVCGRDGTYFSDSGGGFYDAQEITLDQLDEWLGLEVEQEVVEWKNGDECVISTKSKSKWFVVGINPLTKTSTICISNEGEFKSFHTHQLKKPETPEQKAEREKMEEAEEMIQCLLDNYTDCEDSAIDYVIDYLKECETLGK